MTVLVSMTGMSKSFPGVRALHNGSAGSARRRGARPDGRERRRQVDADEDPGRRSTRPMKARSCWKAGRSRSVRRAGAQELGIGIIHQELNLMPDLTAAQNIFIGREPKKFGGMLLDDARLNADAAEIFAAMHLKLDPQTQVSRLTIARQQMVEIAKALSYRSRVLIMDEPTAALNDAEINELFLIIRRLEGRRRGHRLHLPQDGRAEAHRRPRYGHARRRIHRHRAGRDTPVATIIAMMVGRTLSDERPSIPDLSRSEIVLEVRNLSRGTRDPRRELLAAQGRDSRLRRLDGRRPHRGRPRHIRRRSRSTAARSLSTAGRPASAGPGTQSMPASAISREDRKHFGLAVGMDVRNNIAMASLDRFAGGWRAAQRSRHA